MSNRKALGFDVGSSGDEVDDGGEDWRAAKKKVTTKKSSYYLAPKKEEEPAVDESIYAYDEVYEDVSHAKRVQATRSAIPSGPQYIGGLIEAKNRRKQDKLRVTDLREAKEREMEGDEFKDKEVFVTAGYKEHREKMVQKEKNETEAEGPVDMTKFHRAIMNVHDDEPVTFKPPTEQIKEDAEIPEESHKPLQAGLNVTSKTSTSQPWQPYKKHKPSRQSETDDVLRQIEALEVQKHKEKGQTQKKSRLLPKLSETVLEEYRSRYLQRNAASM